MDAHIKQLNNWVEGNPYHEDELDQCCPDFSCCQKELLAPEYERKLFRKCYLDGNDEVVNQMLMAFLQRAIDIHTREKDVHVVGSMQNNAKHQQ